MSKVLGAVLAVLVVAVAAGCGSSDDKSSSSSTTAASTSSSGSGGGGDGKKAVPKKTIGVVDTLYAASAQKRCYAALQAAAKDLGWDVKLSDAQGDPAKALTAAQNFVSQNVDALVMSSTPQAWVLPALKAAKSKGIPTLVICGGIGSQDDGYDAVYTENETKVGEAMSQPIIEDLKNAGPSDILVIGDKAVDAGVKREAAFREGLKAIPNAHVVAAPTADLKDPVQSTQKRAADALTANKGVKAIFTVYDWMIPPTLTALRDAGLADKIKVYGPYADAANLPFLRDAKSPVQAVAEAPLAQTGIVAVDQLLTHFTEDKPLDKTAFDSIAGDIANYKAVKKGDSSLPESAAKGQLDDYQIAHLDDLMAPYLEKWKSKYQLAG